MIHFKATTHRKFKTQRAFDEFMIYLKAEGGLTPEIIEGLETKREAYRKDTAELGGEVITESRWIIFDDGLALTDTRKDDGAK